MPFRGLGMSGVVAVLWLSTGCGAAEREQKLQGELSRIQVENETLRRDVKTLRESNARITSERDSLADRLNAATRTPAKPSGPASAPAKKR